MEFHGTIQKGRLVIPPVQSALRERYLHTLKDGSAIRETLTREGRAKSNQQVKTHFGLVVEMVRQRLYEMRVDVCGVPVNREMVHDILKKACGGVGGGGETLGLSEMTTVQASKFFDQCRTWCATQLSLVIPDPSPNWKEEQAKKT